MCDEEMTGTGPVYGPTARARQRKETKHPATTPLEKWSPAWLKMEVASLLDVPGYLMLHDSDKKLCGYPISNDEMREFISGRREADRLLANPELIEDQ